MLSCSKVSDTTNNPNGFKDGINTDNDYNYDANGNMTEDMNKNIGKINYNHLNLPIKIKFVSEGDIRYIYNALGQKLYKSVRTDTIVNSTDYLDGFQYLNNVLEYFPHAEGYVKSTNVSGVNNFNYVFNYTDHLGNVRLSYGLDAANVLKILEENNYYPFGLRHKNYNMDQRTYNKTGAGTVTICSSCPTGYNYKYNGKELQDELGLNWLDYGWRNYDPAISRWINIDPLFNDLDTAIDFDQEDDNDDEDDMLEALSRKVAVGGGVYNTNNLNPYAYGYNDPVQFDDPDGRCPKCEEFLESVLMWTDLDDLEVMATTVTNALGGSEKPKHLDGSSVSKGDGGFLLAGLLVPGVSGGALKKIFKGGDKVVDTTKKVNGNSKSSTNSQHLYNIFETETKKVVKTGVSGGKISKAGKGKSYRATKQVNKLNKAAGGKKYDSKIVKKIPAGKNARQKILDAEKANANKNRKTLDPNIHKTP